MASPASTPTSPPAEKTPTFDRYTDRVDGMESGTPRRDEEDRKKMNAEYELIMVRKVVHRSYLQCLIIFMALGISIIALVAQDPWRFYVPVASHLVGFGFITVFLLLLLAMLTCSRDATSRFALVVSVTLYLGVVVGFVSGVSIALASGNVHALEDAL